MKQNTSQEFQESLAEITLHSYIQYSGLIALSTVCLFQLYTDAHSTDTGLEQSASQIRFYTRSTLRSSTAKFHLLRRPLSSLCFTPHTDSPCHDCECPLALYAAYRVLGIFSSYLTL